ncbi:hypothetical protein T484DRAFT_1782871 [Baffinella frigidus]|nr:hypothetical protein T484DRAFT_1782871 [Cryptophyta sp. CCMP2293]
MTMGQRLASTAAGRDGAFPASEGMVKLENSLEDQGLMLDRSGGGGNVYLTLAELIHKAGLEVQGLMFTMWGEEQEGALVGALSQKARTDAKKYINNNIDDEKARTDAKKYINNNIDDEVFDRPGEFLGDHDLLALARIYKVRIKVMMVIYDTEVQTKEFGPEEGVEAKATLYMCLDRKRFWPVVQIADPEAEARKKEMAIEKENAPPPPKKRLTALEKIQQKYAPQAVAPEGAAVGGKVSGYAPEAAALEGGAGGGKASGFPGGAVTVKASQKQSATVILLHGIAGSGADWVPLAEALHLRWAKFISADWLTMAGSGADWAPLAEALHLPWAKFIFPTAGTTLE